MTGRNITIMLSSSILMTLRRLVKRRIAGRSSPLILLKNTGDTVFLSRRSSLRTSFPRSLRKAAFPEVKTSLPDTTENLFLVVSL